MGQIRHPNKTVAREKLAHQHHRMDREEHDMQAVVDLYIYLDGGKMTESLSVMLWNWRGGRRKRQR